MSRALILALAVLAAVLLAGCSGAPVANSSPTPTATLVLTGTSNLTLSYADVLALPSVNGTGGAVSTTGILVGPFQMKGVALATLAGLVGGIGPNQTMHVHARDGYMWVLDRDRVNGKGLVVFTPELKEMADPPPVVPVLIYELKGMPLSMEREGPFRIAVLDPAGTPVITEGSAWVKWVDRIEIY